MFDGEVTNHRHWTKDSEEIQRAAVIPQIGSHAYDEND